jgi:hypothetical protein
VSAVATEEHRPSENGRVSAAEAVRRARRQLSDVTGRAVEAVTSIERTDDGWRVELEVLELHRVPETTDVLAAYDVTLTPRGRLVGFRRERRYHRGQAGGRDD